MNQGQQQQQQQQLPLGEPQYQLLSGIYSQLWTEAQQSFQFQVRYTVRLNVQNMNLIQIQLEKPRPIDQQRLFLQNNVDPNYNQMFVVKFKAQNQETQYVLDKQYLETEFFIKINYNEVDFSKYSENITGEDINNFIGFLIGGQLQFPSTKVPTYICLLGAFQLHIFTKDIITQLINYASNQQLHLNTTQKYDDILLYHLFEQFFTNQISYSQFICIMLFQQWFIIQSKVSWFSNPNFQDFQISPLLSLLSQEQLEQYFWKSFYFQERIYFFNSQKFQSDYHIDLILIVVRFNQLVQQYYQNQSDTYDPSQKTQLVHTMINKFLPLDKNMNMGLFKEIKDFYNPKLVNEILISQLENLQRQVKTLEEEKIAYIFNSKLSIWQLQSHQ